MLLSQNTTATCLKSRCSSAGHHNSPYPPKHGLCQTPEDPCSSRNLDVSSRSLKACKLWVRADADRTCCFETSDRCTIRLSSGEFWGQVLIPFLNSFCSQINTHMNIRTQGFQADHWSEHQAASTSLLPTVHPGGITSPGKCHTGTWCERKQGPMNQVTFWPSSISQRSSSDAHVPNGGVFDLGPRTPWALWPVWGYTAHTCCNSFLFIKSFWLLCYRGPSVSQDQGREPPLPWAIDGAPVRSSAWTTVDRSSSLLTRTTSFICLDNFYPLYFSCILLSLLLPQFINRTSIRFYRLYSLALGKQYLFV